MEAPPSERQFAEISVALVEVIGMEGIFPLHVSVEAFGVDWVSML